jgi:radical SAM superfamily enzyme YgiQ (UPF0313 family)
VGSVIILFNPLSTTPGKQPLPLSLMALAAVLEARMPWRLVDGNVQPDPAAEILSIANETKDAQGIAPLLAVTVMPGPQVAQAVEVCRRVRAARPDIHIVWGGYFPTQHTDTVMQSPLVDFVVRSQGEGPLLQLIDVLRHGGSLEGVSGLSWKRGAGVVHNAIGALTPLDDLPSLPYHRVDMPKTCIATISARAPWRTTRHSVVRLHVRSARWGRCHIDDGCITAPRAWKAPCAS